MSRNFFIYLKLLDLLKIKSQAKFIYKTNTKKMTEMKAQLLTELPYHRVRDYTF